jgi:hypothetical protein
MTKIDGEVAPIMPYWNHTTPGIEEKEWISNGP